MEECGSEEKKLFRESDKVTLVYHHDHDTKMNRVVTIAAI